MTYSTITGTKLDRLGAKLDKQVAVADLVLSSFLFKLTSTNYLDSCRRYVLLSNLVTGTVYNVVHHLRLMIFPNFLCRNYSLIGRHFI